MLQRIANLFRGFLSLFISGLEKRNPEALLEVEKENLREQIGKYNQGLASHAALCERLMTQVRKLEGDERDLRAKTTANLKAGNQDAAGQYALRLQTVTRELGENRTQLQQAEDTYKNLVKAREQAAGRARVARDSMNTAEIDLKDSEQKALASQALADFAAREGLTLQTPAAPSEASAESAKVMGPRT